MSSNRHVRLGRVVRDLLFPPRCVGCGELLEPFSADDSVFCPLCRTAWEVSVGEAAGQAVEDAARGLIYLTYYHSGRADGIPERLIYHVKHQGDPRVLDFVAARLAPRIRMAVAGLPKREGDCDGKSALLFTYPPRRRAAVHRDGFDQASRLAQALAKACGGGYATLIRRPHRKSAEQKKLDAEQRADNARRSYVLRKHAEKAVRGRVAVVCDDLCTTGATLNRCAELLVEAGASLVILVTIARTGGKT